MDNLQVQSSDGQPGSCPGLAPTDRPQLRGDPGPGQQHQHRRGEGALPDRILLPLRDPRYLQVLQSRGKCSETDAGIIQLFEGED